MHIWFPVAVVPIMVLFPNLVDGADLKLMPNFHVEENLDKLINMVQFLVLISVVICVLVLFGEVVMLIK